MPIDKDELLAILEEGGKKLADLIKDRAQGLLDVAKMSNDFIVERSKRLAELGIELAKAATDSERDAAKASMETVTDAITSECWAIAVDMSAHTRSTLHSIILTAKDFLVSVLPVIAKALI